MSAPLPSDPRTAPVGGRGPAINPPNRFERLHLEACADWDDCAEEERPHPLTRFYDDASESILSKNDSPDIPFTYSMNSYRGCEHGCAYCFARPTHEYLGFSSGLDFETRIMVKRRAPELLRQALGSRRWHPESVTMSGVTDCYQPAERHFRLTRGCLEVFSEFRNPVGMITKNFLVTRDLDLLIELARWRCVAVFFSVTSLDSELAGKLEPRAARPDHRIRAIRMLSEAGVPVGVMMAPVIHGLNEHEMPAILDAAATAGARFAGYATLRLPHAVKDVFLKWLDDHAPAKKARIVDRLQAMHGGRLYNSAFGTRGSGTGVFADQTRALFEAAVRRVGLNRRPMELSVEHFRRPGGTQLELL